MKFSRASVVELVWSNHNSNVTDVGSRPVHTSTVNVSRHLHMAGGFIVPSVVSLRPNVTLSNKSCSHIIDEKKSLKVTIKINKQS